MVTKSSLTGGDGKPEQLENDWDTHIMSHYPHVGDKSAFSKGQISIYFLCQSISILHSVFF